MPSKDIPPDQMQIWKNPPLVPEFHLPEVNRFIPTNFDLLPREEDDEVPVDLNLEPGRENARAFGQLWHQQRTKFNVPIAHVTVRLCSNIPKSAKQKAILHLWACALDQRLQTLVYSASEAGLLFSVSAVSNGLEIQVSGFNEKLFLLYQEIFDLLCAPLTNSDAGLLNDRKFSTYKDRLRQKTCNKILNPYKFNCHIRKYLTDATEHLVVDYMKALEALSLDDFVQFVPQMLSQIYLKAFVYGNLSKTEALSFFDYALSSLKPPKAAVLTSLPIPEFPVCVNRLRVMNFNKVDVNTCLSLVTPLQGTPSDDLKLEVMNELFVSCLKEPAFAYLRTSETLGYSVGLYSWLLLSTTRQCGATLTVCSQANKFDSSLVAGRMYAFWYRIIPQIIFRLKPEAFQTAVDSMIASNRLEDATMEVEMRRNRAEILSSVPIFDRRQRAISILQNLTLKDFQDFYRSTYFNNDRQPVLMLQVRSSKFFSNQYIL
uniref:Nardilysin n=1 Tax=Mesocestoides corti TaxID=53468 RepID=A0A5K3EVB5_MESCO